PSSRITRCNYLQELIIDTLSRTTCKMDSIPPARRPHKSPPHPVTDRGTSLTALFRPRHQRARGSRTSHLLFRERQHPVRSFFRSRRGVGAVRFRTPAWPVSRGPLGKGAHCARRVALWEGGLLP